MIKISFIHGYPIQICQTNRGEELFKVPATLNCTNGDKYQEWYIKLEKLNIREYETKAQSLQVIERVCETEQSFFGTKTKNKDSYKKKISRSLAEKLIKQHACITSEGDVVLNPLQNGYQCSWKWMSKRVTKTVSCYLKEGKVYARHDGSVKSDLAGFKSCSYAKKFCYTTDGQHLVWEIAPEVKQNFTLVGEFDAVRINEHILIEKLGMAFKKPKNSGEMWTDREFRLSGKKKNPPLKTIKLASNEDTISSLRDEIDSKFTFLVEMIKSPKAKVAYLCDVFNQMYESEIMLAKIDPTTYIRQKTGNPLLIGKSVGQYIFAYPCLQVEEYSWDVGNGTNCYIGIPIKYKLKGSELYYTGFLQTKHNNIEPRGIAIDCNTKGDTLSSDGSHIYLHTATGQGTVEINTTKSIHLQQIPLTGIGMIDYLEASWAFNTSDLAHVDIDREIIEHLNDKIDVQTAAGVATQADKDVWHLFGVFGMTTGSLISAILMWIERILVLVIAYRQFMQRRVNTWINTTRLNRYQSALEMHEG